MFPYADYQFYKEKTQGKLSEDVFNTQVLEASFFLRYITMGKSDKVQPEELQYAACAIADMYAEEKQKLKDVGTIKSENNDGYSVTYISEIQEGESVEEYLARKAYQTARKYLLYTGLLFRKVGV